MPRPVNCRCRCTITNGYVLKFETGFDNHLLYSIWEFIPVIFIFDFQAKLSSKKDAAPTTVLQ